MKLKERKEFHQPMDQLITHLQRVYKLEDGVDLTDKQVEKFVAELVKERLSV